jgi:TatD DNase family protein
MRLFDSHCHLDFEALSSELDERLDEARRLGVSGWFVPGVRPEQWERLPTIAREDVWFGVGLHPWETDHGWDVDALVGRLRETAVRLAARS